jgi:hypothetical protein
LEGQNRRRHSIPEKVRSKRGQKKSRKRDKKQKIDWQFPPPSTSTIILNNSVKTQKLSDQILKINRSSNRFISRFTSNNT